MKNRILYLTLFIVFISLSGCTGARYTLKGGKIPGISFSIENFENIAPLGNPNLNIVVQDLLRARLLRETSLKYIPSDGDAHFTGTITNYTITPVLGTGSETVNLNRLTITLKVSYANKIDNKNDFEKTFSDFDDFNSSDDINAMEEVLIKKIGDKLVNQVFNQVLVDW
jgi:hypothetical protein